MQAQELIREFKHGSVKLLDPNVGFTVNQVREFYSTVYPELLNADIEGPELDGNRQTYTFRRAVGTKGSAALPLIDVFAADGQNPTPAQAIANLKANGKLHGGPEPKRKAVTVNSGFAWKLASALKDRRPDNFINGSVNLSVLP